MWPKEKEAFEKAAPENLVLQKVYLSFYQNGFTANHILGYTGKDSGNKRQSRITICSSRIPRPPKDSNPLLTNSSQERWAGVTISIDATGKKVSEKVAIPPVAGDTVITTLDVELQRLCEKVLSTSAKRGAIVIIDPNNGDILAMASWPVLNPNSFVPNISEEAYNKLRDNPENPLLPRALPLRIPAGVPAFKVVVGMAALESGAITLKDEFDGPAALQVGNMLMHNWRKDDAGQLNFHEGL